MDDTHAVFSALPQIGLRPHGLCVNSNNGKGKAIEEEMMERQEEAEEMQQQELSELDTAMSMEVEEFEENEVVGEGNVKEISAKGEMEKHFVEK